jgi:hypothetical protein
MKVFLIVEQTSYGEQYINGVHITEKGAIQSSILSMYDHFNAYGFDDDALRTYFEEIYDKIEYGEEIPMNELNKCWHLLSDACENVDYVIVIEPHTLKP